MESALPQLTDAQEIVLNIVAIPSALLSILGSSAIIYLARQRRKVQRWTPYTRFLVAMSFNDILFSMTVASSNFLRPKETSNMIWAFGNDATCGFAGFMAQATSAGAWYQGMLSIYFLLTARYGMKNERIAKRVEPLMHFLALGYPIATAIAGAYMDVYGEKLGAAACWVSSYSDRSAVDAEGFRMKDSRRRVIVWTFYFIPAIAIVLCLIYTQLSIYLFVRHHTRCLPSQDFQETAKCNSDASLCDQEIPGRELAESSGQESSSHSLSESLHKAPASKLTSQSKRLQLVCSQAFLFVMAFISCHGWNFVMALLIFGARNEVATMEVLVKYYPITVLQKTMIPIQGFFNLLIYIRPKYMMLRHKLPTEGRLQTVKRIFRGSQIRINNRKKVEANLEATVKKKSGAANGGDMRADDGTKNLHQSDAIPNPFARRLVSSVTASDGDFDSKADDPGEDNRWDDVPRQRHSGVSLSSALEVISELSETMFELTPYQMNGSHLSVSSGGLSIPTEPPESRWKGTENHDGSATTLGLSGDESELGEGPRRQGADSSPAVPTRRKSIASD